MNNSRRDTLINSLWNWITTFKGTEILKDTTRLSGTKFDAFIESSASQPLSFSVFEMSNEGELVIDDVSRLVESQAAFFLFVNPKAGWVTAVKNTTQNQKKLVRKEPIQNFKVKIIN